MDRITQLLDFYQKAPQDPFNIYALAMEYVFAQKHEEANRYFDILLNQFPNYTPAYFHAARTLIALGRILEAKDLYERGIEMCVEEHDVKSFREIEIAYNNFMFEYQDEIN